MGSAESRECAPYMENPEEVTVLTLSDTLMQRLPVDEDDDPLEKEQRNQSIDDFWYERMECIDKAYLEACGITEQNFDRLVSQINAYASKVPKKDPCKTNRESLETCYEQNKTEPLKCQASVSRYNRCVDSEAKKLAKQAHEDKVKNAKKEQFLNCY